MIETPLPLVNRRSPPGQRQGAASYSSRAWVAAPSLSPNPNPLIDEEHPEEGTAADIETRPGGALSASPSSAVVQHPTTYDSVTYPLTLRSKQTCYMILSS